MEEMMKKIVFVVAGMNGGGTERVIAGLSNYFVKKDYQVTIVMTARREVEYELSKKIDLIFLGEQTGGSIYKRLERIWKLRSIFKADKGQVIISFGTETNLFAIIANMLLKTKLIVSERNDPNQCSYARLRDLIYAFGDYFVFQTREAVECFSKAIQKRSEVIANPIRSSLPQIYEGERRKVIVAVGRLTAQKNYFLLLNSFATFVQQFPEYTLEIYGQGELEKELKELTDKLKLTNQVKFMGFVENATDCIRNAAQYILSSDYEGISNSLLEAMAMGMPVVSTDCPIGGSALCINHGENGLLVPIKNQECLTEAMVQLAQNEAYASQLGHEAEKVRVRFSEEAIHQQWEHLVL